jgi:hypothetical protein
MFYIIGFNHFLIFEASPYINTVMNYCLSGFLVPMIFMDPDPDPALDPDPTLDPSFLCRNSQIYLGQNGRENYEKGCKIYNNEA